MKKLVLFSFFYVFSMSAQGALSCTDLAGASVFSSEDAPKYLGFIGSRVALDSINNSVGSYGSRFSSNSVRNDISTYGNSFSRFSANNDFATQPPKIIKQGVFLTYLSANTALNSVSIAELDDSCTFSNSRPDNFFSTQALSSTTGWGGIDVSLQGSWFNPNRDGEGFVLDFFSTQDANGLVVYFYTYDLEGNQMYLVGSTTEILPGNLDSLSIDVFKTDGTSFGEGFDMGDVTRTKWGSLDLDFIDCGSAIITWFPTAPGYAEGSTEVIRIVGLPTGITCP